MVAGQPSVPTTAAKSRQEFEPGEGARVRDQSLGEGKKGGSWIHNYDSTGSELT
jgi:hypothetical protein